MHLHSTTANSTLLLVSRTNISRQHEIVGHRRVGQHVVDLGFGAGPAIGFDERVDLLPVNVADVGRIDLDPLVGLQVVEGDHVVEGEVDLGLVEHVEQDHFVAAMAEMVQRPNHLLRLVVQIADQHDQAAAFEAVGQPVQRLGDVGIAAGLDRFQPVHHLVEMPRRTAGGHVEPNCRVERGQAHRILLPRHQIRQNGRQIRAVFQLGEPSVVAVAHRTARVQQNLHAHVRLFFVLLDVETIGSGQHAIVEMPRVVAGRVLAMLGELDAETLVRAGMQPADKSLDHPARDHREVFHPGECRRFQDIDSRLCSL